MCVFARAHVQERDRYVEGESERVLSRVSEFVAKGICLLLFTTQKIGTAKYMKIIIMREMKERNRYITNLFMLLQTTSALKKYV